MKTELKPCPFCGGEAHATTGFTTGSDWPQGHFDRIFCGKCQVRQLFHRTKAEAIEAWNRRATPPSPSTAEVDERAAFEVWAKHPIRAEKLPLDRWPENDGYKDMRTYIAFYGWKSGRAGLASRPATSAPGAAGDRGGE